MELTNQQLRQEELLRAIESRMGKNGSDHDAIVRIEEMLKVSIRDREQINDILFGKDRDDGLVGDLKAIKSKINWFWLLGGGMFSALVYLVVLHIAK